MGLLGHFFKKCWGVVEANVMAFFFLFLFCFFFFAVFHRHCEFENLSMPPSLH